MKKFALSLITLSLLTFSSVATAQVIIIEPGCHPDDPCSRPAPVRPRYTRVAPARYVAPAPAVQPVAVAPAPQTNLLYRAPLKRWSITLFTGGGADDAGDYDGGGAALSYMFSRYWGIEAAFEGYGTSSVDYYYEQRSIARASLSALWYLGGINPHGFNLYFKGGIVAQSTEYSNYDYGYGDNVSGSAVQFGGGLQWRFFDGSFSMGIEALAIGPVQDDSSEDSEELDSGSFNFRFTLGYHF